MKGNGSEALHHKMINAWNTLKDKRSMTGCMLGPMVGLKRWAALTSLIWAYLSVKHPVLLSEKGFSFIRALFSQDGNKLN